MISLQLASEEQLDKINISAFLRQVVLELSNAYSARTMDIAADLTLICDKGRLAQLLSCSLILKAIYPYIYFRFLLPSVTNMMRSAV